MNPGSNTLNILTAFLEQYLPTACPSHLCGALALLLADALKAGMLRFVVHKEQIIEDSLR